MTVRLDTHTKGYRILRIDGEDVDGDGPRYYFMHRLVAYARGGLESPAFAVDGRETHHIDGVKDRNGPDNLSPLSPEDHGQTTRAADAPTTLEVVGTSYTGCPSCGEAQPHHVREDDSRRCVVCKTVTEVPDADGVAVGEGSA